MPAVFSYRGRPCIVTGEQRRKFRQGRRWVRYVALFLDYLDGGHPATDTVGQGTFKAAKAIRGVQGAYWKRMAELKAQGMPLDEARRHVAMEAEGLRVE